MDVRDSPPELHPMATTPDTYESRSISSRGSSKRQVYSLADFPNLPKPKRKVVQTFFGVLRAPDSVTWLEWAYLGISLVSITASVGMTIARVVDLANTHPNHVHPNGTSNDTDSQEDAEYHSLKADYTFGLLLIWTALFAYYHVIFGVFCVRKGDIIIYMVSTAIVWAYVVINYFTSTSPPTTKLVRLIITTVVAPVILGIGIKLAVDYSSDNQLIYYSVGPDLEDQSMFKMLLLHDCVIKFDLQMTGSVLILWQQQSFLEKKVDLTELIIAITGVVIAATWVTVAYLASMKEKKWLTYIFFVLSVFAPAEVVVNIVRLSQLNGIAKSLLISTIICGIVSVTIRTFSIYTMVKVTRNFGKGLKEKIFKTSLRNSEEGEGQRGGPQHQ